MVEKSAGQFAALVRDFRRLLQFSAAALVAVLLASAAPRGQTSSAIEGTVRDESGGVMPGVTLTLTSPQLQVPQMVQVSDAEGFYRFSDLRVGTYRVQTELAGFQSFVRENLQLDSGFVARLDVVVKVGALQETVTVSGASPVVDVVTTRGGQTLATDLATKTLPMLGHQADMVRLVPGLEGGVGARAANPTGMGQGYNFSITAYGQSGTTAYLEDFEIHQITQPALTSATEQMDVRSYGNGAQNHMAGVALNYIFPSGGNQFHGKLESSFLGRGMVSDNLTDDLRAQGLTVGEVTKYHSDSNASLGGRIIPNKLWFFGAGRWRQARKTQAGTVANAGPDGQYLTGDEPAAWLPYKQYGVMGKGSLQVSPKYQIVGIYYHDNAKNDGTAATTGGLPASARTIPFEASTTYAIPEFFWNGQFRGTPRNDLSYYVVAGRSQFETQYFFAPGIDPLIPTRYDRNSQLFTGGMISNGTYIAAERTGKTAHWMGAGTVTYVPTGGVFQSRHTMKAGYKIIVKEIGPEAVRHRAGDYLLIYDRGVPTEVYIFSLPVKPRNRDNVSSLFVEDSWRAADRVTLNLGLRAERSRSFVPPQRQEEGQFVEAQDYAKIEVGAWTTFAPRLAAAWDITGSGKSVVKASWGIYNDLIFGAINSYAENHNPVTGTVHAYRWSDQDRSNNYTDGEVNLDLNGPDYLRLVTGGNTLSRLPDLDFKVPRGTELALSLEHEIIPGMGGKFLFIQKKRYGPRTDINPARPYDAYNIPLQRRDPGPDGNINTPDDGPMVTIYDYDPAYRGNAFEKQQAVNEPDDLADTATTFEGSVAKRLSNRWSVTTSYGATHQEQLGFPQNPNTEYYNLTDNWSHAFRANGSYELPWRVSLGTSLNVLSGFKTTRTYIFRAADPLGGPPLRQLSTATLRLEEPGATRGPVRKYWDVRAGRAFSIGSHTLDLAVDLLNVINAASIENLNGASGPTFGQVTQISAPRLVRVGVQYRF
ncbi:MAG: hypothetical protein GEU82_18015 [Luteitalea sp.]|nr:hypothetical protein [Luteitalea sp.]